MSSTRYKILLIIVLVATKVTATQFRTQRLSDISRAVGISITDSTNIQYFTDSIHIFKGKPLHIKADEYGEIAHIGYKLFNDSVTILQKENIPIFDFVERYLLELDLMLDGRSPLERMKWDRVTLVKGTVGMLSRIDTNTPVSIEEIPRRMFRLTWLIGKEELTITFLSDCQLIRGADIIELENLAEKDIQKVMPLTKDEIIQDWVSFQPQQSQNLYVIDGGYFISEMVRADVFLKTKNGALELLCDKNNPTNSVSNIMVTGMFERIIPMTMQFKKYGHVTDTLNVSLQQFITFCKNEGCKMYYGVEKMNEEEIIGSIFAFNEKLAYNHILYVKFPLGILNGEEHTCLSITHTYIPLHDIEEEFFNQFKHKVTK